MQGKVTCFSCALVPRFFITNGSHINGVIPRGCKTQTLELLRPRSIIGNTGKLLTTTSPVSVKAAETFPAELFTGVSRSLPSLLAPLVGLSPIHSRVTCVVSTHLRLWGQSSQDTRLKKKSNPKLIL